MDKLWKDPVIPVDNSADKRSKYSTTHRFLPMPAVDNLFQQDVAVSHAILNFAFSGYQGEFAATNCRRTLGDPSATEPRLQEITATLTKLHQWVELLFQGDCLFSATWSSPQTFEARRALTLLGNLRAPLLNAADEMQRALTNPDLASSPADVTSIISGFVRAAYSTHTYLFGQQDAARRRSRSADSPVIAEQVQQAALEVQRANIYTAEYHRRGAALPPEFYRDLRLDASRIPGALRSQVHDIHQLLAPLSGGEAFITNTFTAEEQMGWQQVGISARDAGYWRAFLISPEEAAQWIALGIESASIADVWRQFGFAVDEAGEWAASNISPAVAKQWKAAGFSTIDAKSYLSRGIFDPRAVPQGE